MNAWKLNTDLAAVAEPMRPIETIRRRLDIPMETWARWLGMSRTHYSALINGRETSKYHQAHLALAEKIEKSHHHWQGRGLDEGQVLEHLECLYR